MSRPGEISDKSILQKLNQRLLATGTGARSGVTAEVNSGTVTLSGAIQYEHQRHGLTRAANGVAGVRRVIDRVQVVPKASKWS